MLIQISFAIDFTKKDIQLYYDIKAFDEINKLSESQEWKNISGWNETIIAYTAENQDKRGYANEKGLVSPQEDFINFTMEYIHPSQTTVENSIKCRTPNKYKFMKKNLKNFTSPLEQKDIVCETLDNGFLNDLVFIDPLNFKPIDFGKINPSTVLGFELLYATPGTADAAEIAGHLLLRIKLDNNPHAKKLSIENPNDIVVSFLADTKKDKSSENKIKIKKECKKEWFNFVDTDSYDLLSSIDQSLKGLFGGFLTIMDRQTLRQTIKNYTIEEDRSLLRFELILDEKQKKDLLNRLFEAKKNYKSRYYFFDQNCASVLVKVIGQGINVKEIEDFNPIVSPPNTLVALFTRLGLAKPVFPSFYSYRKKGYIAQNILKQSFKKIQKTYEKISFPKIEMILSDDIEERISFIEKLKTLYLENDFLKDSLWNILNLIQEAEMSYEYKDLICEDYTSKVTSQSREFLKLLRKESVHIKATNIDQKIISEYKDIEKEIYNEGINHTQLLTFTLGLGKNNNENITHIDSSLTKQSMGSFSNISMQRSSSVELGQFSANFLSNYNLSTWGIKGLSIQKMQERLIYTPNFFSSAGSLGFGINVLNYRGDKNKNYFRGTILGGELLFNLISSKNYNDNLFISLGADLTQQRFKNFNDKGLSLPTYIQSTLSFFTKNELQWKNKVQYNTAISSYLKNELEFSSEIKYRLPEINNKIYLLKMKFDYSKPAFLTNSNRTLWLGIEINKW